MFFFSYTAVNILKIGNANDKLISMNKYKYKEYYLEPLLVLNKPS